MRPVFMIFCHFGRIIWHLFYLILSAAFIKLMSALMPLWANHVNTRATIGKAADHCMVSGAWLLKASLPANGSTTLNRNKAKSMHQRALNSMETWHKVCCNFKFLYMKMLAREMQADTASSKNRGKQIGKNAMPDPPSPTTPRL